MRPTHGTRNKPAIASLERVGSERETWSGSDTEWTAATTSTIIADIPIRPGRVKMFAPKTAVNPKKAIA